MKWIKAHKLLVGIICTILVLCFIILLSFLNRGSNSPIGRQIEGVTSVIQRPFASAAFGIRDGIFRFRHTLAEIEELREENARLRQEINKINLTARDTQELQALANIFNYNITDYDFRAVAANIISLDGTNWFNVFTIDKGFNQGVRRNAVVMNGDGLIGTVMEVSSDSAKVISVIDTTNKVSFIVGRDPDMIGILQGDGNGGLSGFMLDNQAGVIEGDDLLTSGIGTDPMYPRGIAIGKVISVDYNMDTQLKTITIEPSVNFNYLRKVAVIL